MTTKHPWFPGKNVESITVHRVFTDARGKDLPGRLQGGRLVPSEMTDDSQLRERFGAGRFRVTGRDSAGRLCGPPYMVDVPDEHGRIPLVDEVQDEAAGGSAGGLSWRDMVRVVEKRAEDQAKSFEFMLKSVQNDRKADLQFFSDALAQFAKVLTPAATPAAAVGNEDFLLKRLEHLEKEVRKERERADEWKTKVLKKDTDDSLIGSLLEKGPAVLEMFKSQGGGSVNAGEIQAQFKQEFSKVREVRERLERELKRAESVRVEYERKLDELGSGGGSGGASSSGRPSLEEIDPNDFDVLLSSGKVLADEVVEELKQLHAAGRVPAEHLAVLKKHKVL